LKSREWMASPANFSMPLISGMLTTFKPPVARTTLSYSRSSSSPVLVCFVETTQTPSSSSRRMLVTAVESSMCLISSNLSAYASR
jgi:hypothetical protein